MTTMVVTTKITTKYLMNKTKWDLSQMIMDLLNRLDRLEKCEDLMNEFCDRCESGTILSRKTYSKFCKALGRENKLVSEEDLKKLDLE